jgi:hypothetical protein
MVRAAHSLSNPAAVGDANTIVGNKMVVMTENPVDSDGWPLDDKWHEIVLRSSAQCLPMIKFDRALGQNNEGKECIGHIQKSLQEILDRLFNKGLQRSDFLEAPLISKPRTATSAPLPGLPFNPPVPPQPARWNAALGTRTKQYARKSSRGRAPSKQLATKAARPSGWSAANAYSPSTTQTLTFTAPRSLSAGVPSNALNAPDPASFDKKEICVICHGPFKRSSRCVALNACAHIFHKECVKLAFKNKPRCPVCRVSVGEPQGKCPSGTMSVSIRGTRCSGYQVNSILITYNIPPGTQMSYHDNPGRRHGRKCATAYLPNNTDGQNLLKRLKYSFLHGLSFAVGTSMTTGMADQCTW